METMKEQVQWTATYQKLFELASPIVKSFRDDLIVHDKTAIEKAYPENTHFLHFSRDTGTHIVFFTPASEYPAKGEKVPYLFGYADRDHILCQTIAMVLGIKQNDSTKLILYFDGNRFKKIGFAKAEDLVRGYIRSVRYEWSK